MIGKLALTPWYASSWTRADATPALRKACYTIRIGGLHAVRQPHRVGRLLWVHPLVASQGHAIARGVGCHCGVAVLWALHWCIRLRHVLCAAFRGRCRWIHFCMRTACRRQCITTTSCCRVLQGKEIHRSCVRRSRNISIGINVRPNTLPRRTAQTEMQGCSFLHIGPHYRMLFAVPTRCSCRSHSFQRQELPATPSVSRCSSAVLLMNPTWNHGIPTYANASAAAHMRTMPALASRCSPINYDTSVHHGFCCHVALRSGIWLSLCSINKSTMTMLCSQPKFKRLH